MTDNTNKEYSKPAQSQIKGEAFFQSIVAEYSLPHHIVAPMDLGIDYICEWTFGENPTGILWAAQVKTRRSENVTIQSEGVEELNGLEKSRIVGPKLEIDDKTRKYWKGLRVPMFLFAVIHTPAQTNSQIISTATTKDSPVF